MEKGMLEKLAAGGLGQNRHRSIRGPATYNRCGKCDVEHVVRPVRRKQLGKPSSSGSCIFIFIFYFFLFFRTTGKLGIEGVV